MPPPSSITGWIPQTPPCSPGKPRISKPSSPHPPAAISGREALTKILRPKFREVSALLAKMDRLVLHFRSDESGTRFADTWQATRMPLRSHPSRSPRDLHAASAALRRVAASLHRDPPLAVVSSAARILSAPSFPPARLDDIR